MSDFDGPDKLIATILATIGPQILFWENVKSLDVQRLVNSMVLQIESEEQEYIGMGRESLKTVEVSGTLFLLEKDPLTLQDENTLEGYLQTIHTNINQYDNSSQADTVVGHPVVWTKITHEQREEEVRGIILYEILFEVMIYLGGQGE